MAVMAAALTVGDFSRVTHLSVKTLRHYHEVGLLEPARWTPAPATATTPRSRSRPRRSSAGCGTWRCRCGGQVVLAAPDAEARNGLIAAHLDRLEAELARTRAAVDRYAGCWSDRHGAPVIEHRTVPATSAIAHPAGRRPRRRARPGGRARWASCTPSSAPKACTPPGRRRACTRARSSSTAAARRPCSSPSAGRLARSDGSRPSWSPPAELAIIRHRGSLADADLTYGELGAYAMRHEISVEGPLREYYLRGIIDTPDPADWETEIGWPIFRADGET